MSEVQIERKKALLSVKYKNVQHKREKRNKEGKEHKNNETRLFE